VRTDILGQTIPKGRITAPTSPQMVRRSPRNLILSRVADKPRRK
jgi:hypothetical protein